jgi:hypothetical protein
MQQGCLHYYCMWRNFSSSTATTATATAGWLVPMHIELTLLYALRYTCTQHWTANVLGVAWSSLYWCCSWCYGYTTYTTTVPTRDLARRWHCYEVRTSNFKLKFWRQIVCCEILCCVLRIANISTGDVNFGHSMVSSSVAVRVAAAVSQSVVMLTDCAFSHSCKVYCPQQSAYCRICSIVAVVHTACLLLCTPLTTQGHCSNARLCTDAVEWLSQELPSSTTARH